MLFGHAHRIQNLFAGFIGVLLVAALLAPTAANATMRPLFSAHVRYRFVDVGTFGGPMSYFIFTGPGDLNDRGVAIGAADTTIRDPFAPNACLVPDCLVPNSFAWKNGVLSDLGVAPGDIASIPAYVNNSGGVASESEKSTLDPITGFIDFDATFQNHGPAMNIGTLGGHFMYAAALNDQNQVVGFGTTTTPDPYPLGNFCFNFPLGAQMHAYAWRGGILRDIGTLGTGPDSCALWVNQRGEAAGNSYINPNPNPSTGFPTQDPFVWSYGRMIDLGSLGGTIGTASAINNHTEVVGTSNLSGDSTFHPFLWRHGPMTDLGTLGGNDGQASWLNDRGEIVGKADLPGSATHDAFLWSGGVMHDLGSQDGDPCSYALFINDHGQVVGGSTDCSNFLHAFLWQPNTGMIDLNTFVPQHSTMMLFEATSINNAGVISAQGVLPNGDLRAVLLIPCRAGEAGCTDSATSTYLPKRPMGVGLALARLLHRSLGDRYLIPTASHWRKVR
jgi:probable HAF family extracellular repeat protein